MEDVLTGAPPPSRFFHEDLNNFSEPPRELPSPFLIFSRAITESTLHPSLLIIAVSSPSLHLFHHISSNKDLIGALILPEILFSGNTIDPSLKNKSCNIYSIGEQGYPTLLVSVQYPVPPERSHAFARTLFGGGIKPERVVIFDSVQSQNFRNPLPPDELLTFKIDTSLERRKATEGMNPLLKGVPYFPSGSLVEGLSAALLCRCEMMKIRASLSLTWPSGMPSIPLVKSLLLLNLLLPLEFDEDEIENEGKTIGRNKGQPLMYEIYT